VYTVLSLSVIDARPSPTSAQQTTWVLALVLELTRLATFLAVNQRKHPLDGWQTLEVLINVLRVLFLLALVIFYFLFTVILKNKRPGSSTEEAAPLLANGFQSNGSASRNGNYGSTHGARKDTVDEDDQPGWVRPEKTPSRSWFEYIRGYSVFFPYLWPSKDRRLQIVVVICFCLVLVQRGVNVLVPYQIGVITDELSRDHPMLPWQAIMLYIFYRMLQGSNSLIGSARSTLWIPVSQYSYRELSVASFEHVHSLSLDFHLGKKTGEVLSALGKGNSINNFLDQITFQVVPMVVDLTVAIGYFLIAFDAYYALVVAVMTFWYGYVTIRLAKWRADARRKMVNDDRHQDAVK
jgi:ATP-binding cassette, subfamily B, vacuolar membrane transporter HMT1/ACLQ